MNKTEIKITVEIDETNVPTAVDVKSNGANIAILLLAATRMLEILQDQIKEVSGHELSDLMGTLLCNTVGQKIGSKNDN